MVKRVRAVIIDSNKILLIKRVKPEETYWVIPGGAVEDGESQDEAIIRECKEELGLDVEVGESLIIRKSDKPETRGQTESFYLCKIIGGEFGTGDGPEFERDTHYVGKYELHWINLNEICDMNLKPFEVRDLIVKKLSLNKFV